MVIVVANFDSDSVLGEKMEIKINIDGGNGSITFPNKRKGVLVNFILDGSGSMYKISEKAKEGFMGYIENLKRDTETDYYLSLTIFDTSVVHPYVVTPLSIVDSDILNKTKYPLGGNTALLDAQGRAFIEAERMLSINPLIDTVIAVTLTDGEENASTEFKAPGLLKSIIDRLTATGKWTFVYLGANQDAFAVGTSMGYTLGNIQNYRVEKAESVFNNLSMGTMTRAAGASKGIAATSSYFADAGIKDVNDDSDPDEGFPGWAGSGRLPDSRKVTDPERLKAIVEKRKNAKA